MRQLILDIRPDSPPDFANFLPGPNAEALAALRTHQPHITPDPVLYLWGEAGVGKSHLAQAWARATAALLASAQLPEPPLAALAVEDVDHLDGVDQIRLFNLINAARETGGLILATGPLPPARLEIRPDLATRLAQGLVFRLLPLREADKAAALMARAEGRGLALPDEVRRYLLTHTRRDLPRLLALVDELDAYSLSRKRAPSLPLLKEMLEARA
jgi:DnaA family protein